jgi:hypothetical protein
MSLNASFITSIMNVKADIYTQTNSQDPNTGAIVRQWSYYKTVQCKIEPIKVAGSSTRSDNKTFATSGDAFAYTEKLQLKIKTTELLSKRWRIENIRSSDNQQVFVEIDKNGKPDSMFEVYSSHAVLDPFGKVSYFEATLQRVQVQDNDPTQT